jgi:hypothetical protein
MYASTSLHATFLCRVAISHKFLECFLHNLFNEEMSYAGYDTDFIAQYGKLTLSLFESIYLPRLYLH